MGPMRIYLEIFGGFNVERDVFSGKVAGGSLVWKRERCQGKMWMCQGNMLKCQGKNVKVPRKIW